MAALSRMSRGEHRSITLTRGDLIIMSSSQIPGNEEAIFGVIDSLAKIGVRVVTNGQVRIHVSGHAYAGELLFLYNGVRPRNVMPVHGTWRHLRANAALAEKSGVPEENIVLAENGVSVDLVAGKASDLRCGAGGQDVRRRSGHRRRRRCHARRTAGAVIGFHRRHRRASTRGTGKLAAPPHLQSRGFSEDPKALEPATRMVEEALETLAGGEGYRSDPHRAGRAARHRQVGGREVPPPADDRADGPRGLSALLSAC